jgi:hypothetical protein
MTAKMKINSVLTLIVLFLIITGFEPSDKKEKKAKQKLEMAQLIQNGRFMFSPNSASSNIGNINQIIYGYYMVFDSLNVTANLPYYGKSYASYYRLTNGIRFDVRTENMKKSWSERKKEYTIKGNLKNNIESYSITLTAGLNGFADLKIIFSNDELITFYGAIEKLPANLH